MSRDAYKLPGFRPSNRGTAKQKFPVNQFRPSRHIAQCPACGLTLRGKGFANQRCPGCAKANLEDVSYDEPAPGNRQSQGGGQ